MSVILLIGYSTASIKYVFSLLLRLQGSLMLKCALYSKTWHKDVSWTEGRKSHLEAGQTQTEVSAGLNVPQSVVFKLGSGSKTQEMFFVGQ